LILRFLLLFLLILFPFVAQCLAEEAIEWKVVHSSYPTEDIVVAACNVLDFGALGDGRKDNTSAFKQALKAVKNIGGGTVFVPK
jgi:polygalacturonase